MKTSPEAKRGVSPALVSAERRAARPPRSVAVAVVTSAPGSVMGNRAFMRAWAARRAQAQVVRAK